MPHLVRTEIRVSAVQLRPRPPTSRRFRARLVGLLTQTVLIKKRKGEFQIATIRSDLDFLRIARSPEGRSDTFRIDVGLDRQRLRPGPITGSIRVMTSDAAARELLIHVRGEVRSTHETGLLASREPRPAEVPDRCTVRPKEHPSTAFPACGSIALARAR